MKIINLLLKNKLLINRNIITTFLIFGGFLGKLTYSYEIEFTNGNGMEGIDAEIIDMITENYEGRDHISGHYSGVVIYDEKEYQDKNYIKPYRLIDYKVNDNKINTNVISTAVAIGSHSISGQGGVSIGSYAQSTKEAVFGVNLGFQARTKGLASIAVGAGSLGEGKLSQAYGRNSTAIGDMSIAKGTASLAKSKGSIALGTVATATGENAIAIGSSDLDKNESDSNGYKYPTDEAKRTNASGKNSIALGHKAQSSKEDTLALGKGANASIDKSVALGSDSITTMATVVKEATIGNIKYSGFAGSNPDSVVSIGKSGQERQLQNVAAGQVSNTSTDAINGSQLYSTNMVLGKLADSVKTVLGGDAKVNENGSVSISNIGGTGKNNINDAIKAVKTEVKADNNSAISVTSSNATDGHPIYTLDVKTDNKTVLKDGNTGNLKVNVGTITTEITNSKILAKSDNNDKIALTGDVVKAINTLGDNNIKFNTDNGETKSQTLNRASGLKFSIKGSETIKTTAKNNEISIDLSDKTKKDIEKGVIANSGVANAVAMANLPQVSAIGNQRHNIAGSYGYFNGEHAFALGLSGMNEVGNLVYKASGSLNTKGHVSLGAGIGYQFDNIVSRSKDMLTLQRNGNINLLDEKVYELKIQFNDMKKENTTLKNEVKDLKDKLYELEMLIKTIINN
ncbi:YadA-like family protein [Streptobacillus ratti]|uniref:YadA-like family protein n=1 Tax=Streptobacillus ratti TaxID=1720557 RepID=UPI0009347965|nr:YadA-like family protein [Streptobacillus ratti]